MKADWENRFILGNLNSSINLASGNRWIFPLPNQSSI